MLKKILRPLVIILDEVYCLITHLIICYPTSRIGNALRKIYYKSVLKLKIGEKPLLRSGVKIYNHANIEIRDNFVAGSNVVIDPNDSFGIIIGSDVGIAEGAILRAGNHDYSSIDKPIIWQGHSAKRVLTKDNKEASIILEDDIWIGAYSIIVSGAKICRGSVVAAGSVVSSEIPEYSIVAGNPARVIANRKKINFSNDVTKFP